MIYNMFRTIWLGYKSWTNWDAGDASEVSTFFWEKTLWLWTCELCICLTQSLGTMAAISKLQGLGMVWIQPTDGTDWWWWLEDALWQCFFFQPHDLISKIDWHHIENIKREDAWIYIYIYMNMQHLTSNPLVNGLNLIESNDLGGRLHGSWRRLPQMLS